MWRRVSIALGLALMLGLVPVPASPQVPAAMTVGAVREALVAAIRQLDTALANATGNVKSIGNSLEANARGVVSDIDNRLGDKLEYTFDRLDKTERQLLEDAQALVGQMNSSANALIDKGGATASRVLGDADILAYNTLYSLPCRSQVPRIVYVTPEVLFAGYTLAEVAIHGNFLDIGAAPLVIVDSKPARILARNANSIRLRVPAVVVSSVDSPHSVSIRFAAAQRERRCLLGFIPRSKVTPVPQGLNASILLEPKTTVRVSANIVPVVLQRQTMDQPQHFERGDENCDANYDVDQTYCLPDGWRLVATSPYSGPAQNSANCGSGVTSSRLAGDKCVFVGGKIQGCRYDEYNVMFTTVRNCRGRGWLNYDVTLHGEREVPTEGAPRDLAASAVVPNQANLLLRYDGDLGGQPVASWRYTAKLDFYRGNPPAPIRTVEVSNVDPVVGGIASRLNDGLLTLDLGQVVSELFSRTP